MNKEKARTFTKAESEMAYDNITALLHHIKELKSHLTPGEALPEWVEAKLTLATDYLSTVAHFVDGKKEAGVSLTKSDVRKLDIYITSLSDLKKNVINYSAPGMERMSNRQQDAKIKSIDDANKLRLGVKGSTVGSDPAMSGIAAKFKLGTTKSGKLVNSHFDHPDHINFSEADHGDAAQMHRAKRDELKPFVSAGQTNPKLLEHHENAMMSHSKTQSQMLATGRK
jgi:hypothetical protein